MTTRALFVLPIVVALAGCQAAGTMAGASGSGGGAGSAGAGGKGGSPVINLDAAVVSSGDAGLKGDVGPASQIPPNLSMDAPTFNWDTRTCTGCNDSGGGGGLGSGGSGGSAGSAGSGGRTGSGGTSAAGGSSASGGKSGSGGSSTSGTGGAAAGGSPGTGGKIGAGGSTGGGQGGSTGTGGSRPDAGTPSDVPPSGLDSSSPVLDGGIPVRDANGPEFGSLADARPVDTVRPELGWSPCVARIRVVVPSSNMQDKLALVAGPNTQVVLRAEIVSGGPAAPAWTWQAVRNGSQVVNLTYGVQDPAAAAFFIPTDGEYAFTVRDQSMQCSDSLVTNVVPGNTCPDCDGVVIRRAAPPPSANIPVQTGAWRLTGSPPFSDNNIVPDDGEQVAISPSLGGTKVASYVRINSTDGVLVADGLADPWAAFGVRLLSLDQNLALLKYDVLVVPIDGENETTIAATAPQLYQSMTPGQINSANFGLSGGVNVTGKLTSSSGQPVADARVILTNRNPGIAEQNEDLIFSSVGRADAQGNFLLHVQRGQYWVSFSPPSTSGFAEALAPTAITLTGDTEVSFQWTAPTMAALTLNVTDATGAALNGARVRLTSAQPAEVGTLRMTASGNTLSQQANGNVRVEGTTSGGLVSFASLPAGVAYNALIVPETLGPLAATTVRSIVVPFDGTPQTVQAQPQGRILGKLVSGVTVDWAKVHLLVYDRSADMPEAPQIVGVSPDGSYVIGASPGRPYVVMVVPDVDTGLARTFVGLGALEASEFVITQKVQNRRLWIAKVMSEYQVGLSGTALQVFCVPGYPYCVDPTLPLAETTSEGGGAFQLALPDPASR